MLTVKPKNDGVSRSREPGRGHAAPRPGRGPHSYDPHLSRVGGRRRVQRRARPAPLLRPAHGHRDRARRQPGRAPRRGPDPPGRRRHALPALGPLRRHGALGPQRAQLHRARLRAARRRRLLRPRAHRGLPAQDGRHPLVGRLSKNAGRPLAAHGRHLLRACRRPRPRSPRGRCGRRRRRARASRTISTTASRSGSDQGGKPKAQKVNRSLLAVHRRALRQRGGLRRRRSASKSRARTTTTCTSTRRSSAR